jgi:ATP-binding cassette subfamily B protein
MIHHGGGPGMWRMAHGDEAPKDLQVSRALLRRVAGYAWPYRWRILLMLVSILIGSGIGLVPPLLYRRLIDHVLPQRDLGQLNLLAVGLIGIPILNGLNGVVQRYLSAGVGEGITYDLRRSLFNHLQRMSLRFFTSTKTGELMSRLNNDVVGAQQLVTSTAINVVSNVVTLIATLSIMLALEWRLTILAILVLPLFYLPSRRVAVTLRNLARQQLDRQGQMNALMNETLNVSGALLVKLFGRAPLETDRFQQRAGAVRDLGIRQALVGRWLFFFLGLASAVGTGVIWWVGGHLVVQGVFTVGTIVAFAAYLGALYGPLTSLANSRVDFATALVSFERVFEVLDLPVEIDEKPDAVALGHVAGRVTFDGVWFAYGQDQAEREEVAVLRPVERRGTRENERALSEGDHFFGAAAAAAVASNGRAATQARRWAIENVSFEVAPGQVAALVGPSGAGKTTITYLLPRLYDPTRGRILIDGHDLRDVTLASLSDQIGTVTQETYLFHDTILANLLYARPQATYAEVEAACQAANIHDFIEQLPQGYNTIVGERGYRLSGGEKQRVAIARVILKDPRILVLDEATSHLDSQSEALIQSALVRVMHGRTNLIIAHRLSTILSADIILVMDRGRLVEVGTHAELLEADGLYATLYRTQYRPSEALELVTSAPLGELAIGDG